MVTDSGTPSEGLDLNSLLQTAMKGETMSNLLGGSSQGSDAGLLALLLVALRGQGLLGADGRIDQNADRAAIDAAVAAALANANQANNNAMLLLKDVQDSSQEVISAVNASGNALSSQLSAAAQSTLTTSLQNQITNLQGQADIKAGIASSNANIVNEVHEVGTEVTSAITTGNANILANLNTLNTNVLQGFSNQTIAIMNDGEKTRAALAAAIATLPNARELEWQTKYLAEREDNHHNRTRGAVESGTTTVTTNVNQATAVAQNQNTLLNAVEALRRELQVNTQSTIAIGSTMMGNSQTATNVRQ